MLLSKYEIQYITDFRVQSKLSVFDSNRKHVVSGTNSKSQKSIIKGKKMKFKNNSLLLLLQIISMVCIVVQFRHIRS